MTLELFLVSARTFLVFPKSVTFLFWLLFWCEWLVRNEIPVAKITHVSFALRLMGFPQ
jgi:hypothetical protein